MKGLNLYILIYILIYLFPSALYAKVNVNAPTMIGAQVIIEPGQTPKQIDAWFRIMKENGMSVCRIRMFEEYLHSSDSIWDYSLFDQAFRSAEKYDIKIFATLFPLGNNFSSTLGGFKFPSSENHLRQIANYIKNVVTHFKSYKSLYGWVLINEPGSGGWLPSGNYTDQKFSEWKKSQKESDYKMKYPYLVNFDKEKFLLYYNTYYLSWISQEIRKYDQESETHVNNHQIFENIAEYDFPSWRKILTSFGTSAHPSWHFTSFDRSQYTLCLSANCEITRSGAGDIPYWITELQGGNNTYSGSKGFCPTKQEINQWLWTGIGTGVDGIIFWCLNPRSVGEEAGEWALLDFQNNKSDRVDAIREVSKCLDENKEFFANAVPVESPVSIIYIRESMWVENKAQGKDKTDMNYEGRIRGGVIKSAMAYYEILTENGIKTNFKEFREYDWTKKDYKGQCIILANQISLPSYCWEDIRNFVKYGGKLIIEGLTAFYDENMLSLNNTGFPLKDVFGGELSQVVCKPGDFKISYMKKQIPAHLWEGYCHNETAQNTVKDENENIIAIRNSYEKGEVLWIPSLLGLGAIRTSNKAPLSDLLVNELADQKNTLPFSFSTRKNRLIMQTLKFKNEYVTIVINKNTKDETVELKMNENMIPKVLFSDKGSKVSKNVLYIPVEATLVIKWGLKR